MAREYRDSGIEWIGQIPKEWEQYRIKYNTFLKGRIGWQGLNSSDFLDEGYCLITGTDFDNKGGVNWNSCYRISEERFNEDELLHVKKGDLLMTKDGTVGKMAFIKELPEEASLNSHLLIIRQLTKLIDNYFLYWMMLSDVFKGFSSYYQSGTIMSSISQSTLGFFACYCPPLPEQQRIADYLDKVCGEVDEMVALQETMLEELKAYKQSVITEAVTKGLNPNVPMRNSGIDWIGEIPEGWKVCRIKNVASLFGRIGFRGYTSDDLNKDGIGAITLSPSNMKPMGMDYQHVTFLSWKKYEESPEIMIQNEDLLMVKTGSSYGKVSYVSNLPREATINPQILRIVPSILSKYLGYYMQTPLFLYQVEGGVVGGTIPTISQEKINNFYVVLPKGNEQRAIASYLDTKCSEIDSLIALKQAKIDELKEYKKSVIYEYVTGKKEVV